MVEFLLCFIWQSTILKKAATKHWSNSQQNLHQLILSKAFNRQ